MPPNDLALREADAEIEAAHRLGEALLKSNFFPDVASVSKAAVKILAGRELGLGPVESMRAFHIIESKIEFAAEFLAQRVKLSQRYDYRVLELENDRCSIAMFQDGEQIGVSTFTDADRERAGLELTTSKGNLTPWAKFPRSMMFARCISNAVAWFAPDVIAGSSALIDVVRPTSDDASTLIEVDAAGEPDQAGQDVHVDEPKRGSPALFKATKAQLTKLAVLAAEHGWDDDERHRRAKVQSFSDLTKQEASTLIEAWSADPPAVVPEEGTREGDSEPQDDAAVTDAEESEVSPPASGPPPIDPDAPPSEEFKRNVRRQLGRKNEIAPESSILILVRKFYPDVRTIDDVTNGMLGIAFDAFLRRGSCTHPVESREDGGFCRRCGSMVGAA